MINSLPLDRSSMEHMMPFSDAMVASTISGIKDQTRRIIKASNSLCEYDFKALDMENAKVDQGLTGGDDAYLKARHLTMGTTHRIRCRYAPGDRLWVREAFAEVPGPDGALHYLYRSDKGDFPAGIRWTNPRYMPRVASRITLRVEAVRPQRLQEISINDCWNEGIEYWIEDNFQMYRDYSGATDGTRSPVESYFSLWDKLHHEVAVERVAANPWVWRIQYSVVEIKPSTFTLVS